MGSLRRFLALPPGEKGLALRAAATVVLVRATLTAVPFRYWRGQVLGDAGGGDAADGRDPTEAAAADDFAAARRETEQVVRAVARASRFVPGATCLTQAIATRRLLARRGIRSALRIGVARDAAGGAVRAHAGGERNGEVVIGGDGDAGTSLGEFTPLPVGSR
jgi:hypothetical protein